MNIGKHEMQRGQTFVRDQTLLRAINKREVVERYDRPTARRDTEDKRTEYIWNFLLKSEGNLKTQEKSDFTSVNFPCLYNFVISKFYMTCTNC